MRKPCAEHPEGPRHKDDRCGICAAAFVRRKRREQGDHLRALDRARYHRDPEARRKKLELNAAWQRANPDRCRERAQRRRVRESGVQNDLTHQDIADIRELQKGRCAMCKRARKLTVDHIVPVARGGANTRRNVQLLCKSCNCSKNAMDPIDFARRQGKLL